MRLSSKFCILLLTGLLQVARPTHGQEERQETASGESSQEWPIAAPADVGIDPEPLARLVNELPAERKHGLHSLLIARQGQLAFEKYWNGHDREKVHDLRSATKSITSLLLGVALDQGLIGNVSDPLWPYLTDAYPDLAESADEKGSISLAHLLTMSSGLDCDDRDRKTKGQEDRMYRRRDWVRYFLELDVVHPPGEVGRYCTGGVVALGRVIAEVSGLGVPEFARKYLFGPLGIEGERWSRFDRDRQTDTGGHLYLRPRDMAKIGQLVLQDGQWNDAQLVSASWIERSTEEHIRLDGGRPYGYLWWFAGLQYETRKHKVIFASGNGGQLIYVVPDLELVVVFTGGNYNSPKAGLPLELLGKYVVPAVLGGS